MKQIPILSGRCLVVKLPEGAHSPVVDDYLLGFNLPAPKWAGDWSDDSYDTIDHHITHEDCKVCGNEFKKSGTYQKTCNSCLDIEARKKWESLPLVEWDGETPLVIFRDDTYFFDAESILEYCWDNDIEPKDLMLVVCKQSTFRHIEMDFFCDETHDDWEPSDEMVAKVKEFNEFLDSEPTNTWFEGKERVILDLKIEADNG